MITLPARSLEGRESLKLVGQHSCEMESVSLRKGPDHFICADSRDELTEETSEPSATQTRGTESVS